LKKQISLIFCLILFSGPLGAQDDDEKVIKDLEKDKKALTTKAAQMNDVSEKLKHQFSSVPEALTNFGKNKLNPSSLLDEKVVLSLRETFQKSPLKSLSQEAARSLILEKIQNQRVKNYLVNHPKILNTGVEILQDEKALPSAIGIFLRKSDLKLYGFIWLGLLLFFWFIKKIFFSKDWSFLYRLSMSLLLSLSVSTISFGIFYTMFYNELSPAMRIIVKNWQRRNL
jgi:hypothetical protein